MAGRILFFLFCACCCGLSAQEPSRDQVAPVDRPAPAAPATPSNPGLVPANTADYRLGPGDLLTVTMYGVTEDPKHSVRVSNSGKIHLPYLRVIPVTGLTPLELEAEITKRLKDQKLVKDPQVKVLVTEYRAQPVYILGEVNNPGQYVLSEQKYLTDLITMAAGINNRARKEGYLYRRTPNPVIPKKPGEKDNAEDVPEYQIIKVDLSSLLKGEQLELNIPIQGGDLFYVPERHLGVFYVVGDVLRTGSFEIPQVGTPLLVSRALSMAGGPTKTAKMSKGMLVRYDSSGQRQELKVDFAAIFKGKEPDFPVEPNDVIFVPGSHAKTLGYGILGALPSMAGRAVYSSGIRSNGGGGQDQNDGE